MLAGLPSPLGLSEAAASVPGSAVNWAGTPLSTTLISSTQLSATVP